MPGFQKAVPAGATQRAIGMSGATPSPDGSPPNNWQSVFGGPAWEWDARRQQYYMHNFLREQPQLNLHNQEVQSALLDAGKILARSRCRWVPSRCDQFLDARQGVQGQSAERRSTATGHAPIRYAAAPLQSVSAGNPIVFGAVCARS